MSKHTRRGGFTWGELLVILAVVVLAVGLIIPGVMKARENARRNDCLNRVKQLVLGLHNYHDSQGGFPASAAPSQVGANNADGYSWMFEILPGLECSPNYDRIKALETGTVHDPLKNSVAATLAYRFWFRCPGYSGPEFMDPANKRFYITNYKAMSATHPESLACATDPDAVPKYGDVKNHPDGGLVPLKKVKLRDYIDGTSNTMMLTETIDETGSYWAAGNTISLVALPSTVDYLQVESFPYWAPVGFVPGEYDDQAHYKSPVTYFNYDYKTAGPYDKATNITHGPSSGHARVINCGFGDGNSRSVSKNIDQAVLMFFVTRAGYEPLPRSPALD